MTSFFMPHDLHILSFPEQAKCLKRLPKSFQMYKVNRNLDNDSLDVLEKLLSVSGRRRQDRVWF